MGCAQSLCSDSRAAERDDADTTLIEQTPGLEEPLVTPAPKQDASSLSTGKMRGDAGGNRNQYSVSMRSCEESSMVSAQSSYLSPEDDSTIEDNPTWFDKIPDKMDSIDDPLELDLGFNSDENKETALDINLDPRIGPFGTTTRSATPRNANVLAL